jgi:hypothetical protein
MNQFLNIICTILVVGIGVYNDIGATLQTGIETVQKSMSKPSIAPVSDNAVNPLANGKINGAVRGTVVYNKPFNRVNAFQRTRQRIKGNTQRLFFVVTGYLNNDLHGSKPQG